MNKVNRVNGLKAAFWLAKKDLQIEWRRKELIFTSLFFSALVVLVCSFAFYSRPEFASQIVSGVLWLPILFSGILIMGRNWAIEKENGNLSALLLAPIPAWSLYFGKAMSAWLLLTLVEMFIVPWIGFLFPLIHVQNLLFVFLIVGLGTLGFIFAGTLFSSLSAKTNTQDFMLSTILFPLLSPTLLISVIATRQIFEGAPTDQIYAWARIVMAFDLVFLVASSTLFEYVIRDR